MIAPRNFELLSMEANHEEYLQLFRDFRPILSLLRVHRVPNGD
jgi:hypothetical protein